MQIPVFFIGPYDNNGENNQEETCKNPLSGTEHISIFTQN